MANEAHAPFADMYAFGRRSLGLAPPVRGMHLCQFEAFLENGHRRLALAAAMGEAREETGLVGFVGGPPCPDFSVAGRQEGEAGPNGRLTQRYVDLVCAFQPDFFVLENVAGLWTTGRNMDFYRRVRAQLDDAGFEIRDSKVNALRYWVPQDRVRVMAIGFRRATWGADTVLAAMDFPWQRHGWDEDPLRLAWPATQEFVPGLDRPPPPGTLIELTAEGWFRRNHVRDHPNSACCFRPKGAAARFASIMEGDTSRKSFKRLHRWRYSPTVAYGNNEVHLHPYETRRLNVAEALALQSMPRSFALPGDVSLSDMFKCVANAVPYLLARSLGRSLADTLGSLGMACG
jgi:DNA (cytosine-5)-methyltransferase 1